MGPFLTSPTSVEVADGFRTGETGATTGVSLVVVGDVVVVVVVVWFVLLAVVVSWVTVVVVPVPSFKVGLATRSEPGVVSECDGVGLATGLAATLPRGTVPVNVIVPVTGPSGERRKFR